MPANKYTTTWSIFEKFRSFLDNHDQVQGIFSGTEDMVDLEQLSPNEFPLVFYGMGQATLDQGSAALQVEIFVADQYLDDRETTPADSSYDDMLTAQGQTLLIARDIVAYFKNHEAYETGDRSFIARHDLDLPVILTPFTTKTKDHLQGWAMTVTINFDNDNDLCLVPLT